MRLEHCCTYFQSELYCASQKKWITIYIRHFCLLKLIDIGCNAITHDEQHRQPVINLQARHLHM